MQKKRESPRMTRPEPIPRETLERIVQGAYVPCLVHEKDGWHARWRTADGVRDAALDAFVRRAALTPSTQDAETRRFDTLADAWIAALRSRTGLVKGDEAELAAFARELEEWNGAARVDVAARAALVFTLSAAEGRPFTLSIPVPKGRAALRALGQAAFVFAPLKGLRRAPADPGLLATELTVPEAEAFARTGAEDLREAGYRVAGLPEKGAVAGEVELSDAPAEPAPADGKRAPGPVEATLVVRVAGERVDAEDVRFLLDQKSNFVFFRNRWIEVDRDLLRQALKALEKHAARRLTTAEALGFAFGVGSLGGLSLEAAHAHGWLRGLVNELRADGWEGLKPVQTPGFAGTLADYQARGVAWMKFLTDHGFGALLADDMGLGKTVQAIGWHLATHRAGEAPLLVVAPLSVVANWRREWSAFAPGVSVYTHLGEARARGKKFALRVDAAEVVLTSYPLLLRDWQLWRTRTWSGLVLDEAQTVKNPATQLARAVRALSAARRVMLTGTPVENSALDIWSLEDFLNPGFLGSRRAFDEQFAKPLARNSYASAGARLRRALEPFVLRRLKTDPAIARALGPKREIKEYCTLSDAQRREYEDAFELFRSGAREKGDIFALLTALKLICDGENKIARTLDLLETIFAEGESALVFTQYVKVARRIVAAIEDRFGGRVPFLHGGLDAARRQREIAAFEAPGPRAFVLSLRAGGFGLNLVKATHVIHFDRWWNPAVENQATDRAHRIGQTKTVFVHTLITEGTLEERIDRLLEEKRQVAGALVTGGESFLKSLSAEETEALVRL